MEVCTTNNNSNEHHHLTTTTSSSSSSNMLRGSPFQREVREWQRIDPTTGALLTGRLEADRWINGPLNSYGKISDSQNIAQPNGLQQTQRKQLEVLQSRTSNGSMQVIRARTVQTTSSRWSSNNSSATTSPITTAKTTTTTNGYHHSTNSSSFFNNTGLITNGNHYNYNNDNKNHMIPTSLAPQLQISTVGSDVDCDINDDVDVIVDYSDVHDDEDDDHVEQKEEHHRLHLINQQHYNNNNNSSSSSSNNKNSNINSNNNHLQSNFLMLDTAPSLKLSNLMKSSSSVSSNSNSSTASNMHLSSSSKNGAKVSLHTIVGSSNSNNSNNSKIDSLFSSSTSSSSTATQLQQRRYEQQHPTFGKINLTSSSGFTKSRVGVGSSSIDDAELSGVGEKQQQQQQQQQTLTPTQLYRQPKRDLESFRHYNDDDDDDDNQRYDDENVAETLNPSSRFQRRQQIPTTIFSSNSTSQLGRSISTDDLSTEWDPQGDTSTHDEPSEWRRVSKLRRSFQSTATKTSSDLYATTTTPRRPLDLPESSVSVSKIRAELEAGRRLTTAMRNNRVDLAALQNILDGPTDNKPAISKRSSFLTAESLKEIRGKLKKLSDESLYKEDFLAHQSEPQTQDKHIEVQAFRRPRVAPQLSTTQRRSLISPDPSPDVQRSAFQFVTPQPKRPMPLTASTSDNTPKHTTNSLESRLKSRDTTSAEWHLRRKSYGFEKMSPPSDKSMFRMDASTDSGLGRSGELANWSPTESAARATVVQFSGGHVNSTAPVQRRQRPLRSSDPDDSSEELKRHSIAVDDSHYVRKTSQVHLNGFQSTIAEAISMEATRYDTDSPPNSGQRSTQQKRVEFCKTEVHFAAESGRVNIVETDGKPPPTNNFRRRRRTTSGPLENLVKAVGTSDRFADASRSRSMGSSAVVYNATLIEPATAETVEPATSVTVSLPKESSVMGEGSRSSYTSTSGIDTTDNENDEIAAIRGILKNKPIKPKPYHLGENFESPDALWGIQLKSVGGSSPLQPKLENYDAAPKPNSPPAKALIKSVAERVRLAERHQDTAATTQTQCSSYSTKINLNLDDSTSSDWKPAQGVNYFPTNTQPLDPNTTRRPSAQELLLQDLKEHQKILDEGLKSTSLIIKTMRSATEFDEAMRRLSIASIESTMAPIVVPTPMLRSSSYQETTQRRDSSNDESSHNLSTMASHYSTSQSTLSRRYSTESQHSLMTVAPTAAPRLKLIGNTEIPVSQQLSQLRRLYEVAHSVPQDADSADEEVKHYFCGHGDNSDSGGGTQEGSSLEEDHRGGFEYSSSWSRLKAKRTIWRIEAEEGKQERQRQQDTTKTNIMSIELHSPQATLDKQPANVAPVAKPRTLPSSTIQNYQPDSSQSLDAPKEHLKIIKEARGARKLREHELSYFGVQVPTAQSTANTTKTKSQFAAIQTTNPRRTLPQRHRVRDDTTNSEETRNEMQPTKWNLVSDKPDLLRHSSIVMETPQVPFRRTAQDPSTTDKQPKKIFHPVKRIQYSDDDNNDDDEDDEHFYENITNEISSVITVKPPPAQTPQAAIHTYNRKTDLERDERILCEMTHNADQTMKSISDEAAIKDQRRRSSLTRRNAKPLETITEKSHDACIAVKVSRSTVASEAKRTSRHSTPSPTPMVICSRMRTSSQSSNESCPRARSRSISSEREYENLNAKVRPTTRSTKLLKSSVKPTASRSSSRDSQHSSHTPQCSSADEQHQRQQNVRRDERLRTKTKRISSSSLTKAQQEVRRQREHERSKTQEQQRSMRSSATNHAAIAVAVHKEKTKSGSTTRSSQRERVECATTDSSRRHRREMELDPHRRSSSSRRSAATTAEKHDEKRSGNRLVRSMRAMSSHHHDDAIQRASSRSERSSKEYKDKEQSSRSKGHSSQSTQQHMTSNENNQHHHHQHHRHQTQQQHASSPSSSSTNKVRHSSNSGENKKIKSATQHHDSATTHNKNVQNLNGINVAQQNQSHLQPQQQQQHYHQHPQQHVHSLTTATITAKQRERHHGKERK